MRSVQWRRIAGFAVHFGALKLIAGCSEDEPFGAEDPDRKCALTIVDLLSGFGGGNHDADFLHLDQTAAATLIKLAEDAVNLFAGVDEFNLDGEMVRDLQDVGGMDPMCRAKTGHSLSDGRTGDSTMEQKIEKAGINRDAMMLGAIT
jgi:hypothetical protein